MFVVKSATDATRTVSLGDNEGVIWSSPKRRTPVSGIHVCEISIVFYFATQIYRLYWTLMLYERRVKESVDFKCIGIKQIVT